MQLKTLLLGFIFSLLSIIAMPGSSHEYGHSETPVDQATALTIATGIVAELVERNKLDENWASITPGSVEKKVFKDNTEWVAVFVNDKTTDTDKRKLYVFLSLGGDYIAANFTGE